MRRIAWDTETDLIKQGQPAPPLVCVSTHDGASTRLMKPEEGRAWFKSQIADPNVELVGKNHPYDLIVMANELPETLPQIFDAFEAERLVCAEITAKLYDVKLGRRHERYGLDTLAERFLHENVEGKHGPDVWRMNYIELVDIPIHKQTTGPDIPAWIGWPADCEADPSRTPPNCWPEEAISYAMGDAVYHWRLQHTIEDEADNLPNLHRQAYKAWWLALMGAWGFRTDLAYIDELDKRLTATVEVLEADLMAVEIIRPEGSKRCSLCGLTNPKGECEATLEAGMGHILYTTKKGTTKCRICGEDHEDPETFSGPLTLTIRNKEHTFGSVCPKAKPGKHKLSKATAGSVNQSMVRSMTGEEMGDLAARTDPSATHPNICLICGDVGDPFDKAPECGHDEYQGGQVAISGPDLLNTGHPDLMKLGRVSGDRKIIRSAKGESKIDRLRKGALYPLHPKWNPLVATGRTSCKQGRFGYQAQNPDRKAGIRECFKARNGYVYGFADYHIAEVMSLAEVLYQLYDGQSRLAEVILEGKDVHKVTGASVLGITYEEFCRWFKGECGPDKRALAKNVRQLAKVLNFGLPGGMGAATFFPGAQKDLSKDECDTCHGTGRLRGGVSCHCIPIEGFTLEYCKDLVDLWKATYPEMNDYFRDVGKLTGGPDPTISHLYTDRIRGGLTYCNACNTLFQGLTADGGNEAMILVSRECYTDRRSPLWNCRPFAWIHDEVGIELVEGRAVEAAHRLEHLMIKGMQKALPYMASAVSCDAALMRRWRKMASDPVFDESGTLCVFEDRPLKPETVHDIRKYRADHSTYETGLKFGLEWGRVEEITA